MTSQTATVHHVEFDSSWMGFGGIHGGLVVAEMLRAGTVGTGATPVTVTTHFARPVHEGPGTVRLHPITDGRTVSASAALDDSATSLIRLTRTAEVPYRIPVLPATDAAPATLPPLEIPIDFVPMSRYLDIRPVNAARPFAGGDDPFFDVWIALRTEREFAPQEAAAILLDALPPGLFATLTAPVPIPTVEFTAHFAPTGPVTSEWHRIRHRTTWATDSMCVDETELFTADGRLAAQARQLRRILR